MEKIWFRHFGLYTFTIISLILPLSLFAEGEAKSVIVDIEVPVDNNNIAEAKAVAQKQAFEKALDQVLPATMDAKERQQKIKSALQYVKTYQVIEEKSDASVLKQKYKVDIAYQPVETSPPSFTGEVATFEVNWLPDEIRFNTVDLLKYIQETLGTPVNSFRMGRGNMTLTVSLNRSLEETQNQIASFVGKRGLVKLIKNNVDSSTNQLTPAIPVPAPSSTSEGPLPLLPPAKPSDVPMVTQAPTMPAQSLQPPSVSATVSPTPTP